MLQQNSSAATHESPDDALSCSDKSIPAAGEQDFINNFESSSSRASALDVLNYPSKNTKTNARPKLVAGPTTALSSTEIRVTLAEKARERTTASSNSDLSILASFRTKPGNTLDTREQDDHSKEATECDKAANVSLIESDASCRPESLESLTDQETRDSKTFWQDLQKHEPDTDFTLDNLPYKSTTKNTVKNAPEQPDQSYQEWRRRRKNFLILSHSGKPIWQLHGNDALVSSYVGAFQTIISLYESSNDCLKTFTSGFIRFVILSQRPIYLVAISKVGESDAQLRAQLESLYMQILSTLTLPNLERFFSLKPSADLRKPLQGTETLLSALADSFVRGSFSTLLSSLECLRLRNRHRQSINDALLRNRCPELLYGLIVAGNRLVAVIRPKTHSLHPNDLRLILNMTFESDGIQAGGGENWIPICLPGFNRNGFLYMYASYVHHSSRIASASQLATATGSVSVQRLVMDSEEYQNTPKEQRVAILFLSSKKDAFFQLQACRNDLLASLVSKSLLQVISQAIRRGQVDIGDIVPDSPVQHFLYKSKGNLQYFAPSFQPHFEGVDKTRMLCCMYENLHINVHARGGHLDFYLARTQESTCLAWLTDIFELYCIADPKSSKSDLTHATNRIVQWVRKEEERLFILGGAVF